MKLPPTQDKIWTGAVEKKSLESGRLQFVKSNQNMNWIEMDWTSSILKKNFVLKYLFFKSPWSTLITIPSNRTKIRYSEKADKKFATFFHS